MLQTLASRTLSAKDFERGMQQFIESCKHFPYIEPKFVHTICDGIYTRELFLPKNTLAIGEVHTSETLAILSIGTLKYFGKEGLRTLTGHKLIKSEAGVQRAVFTLTDCVFTTIHRTDKTTLKEIEDMLVVGGSEMLIGGAKNKQTLENRRIGEKIKSISQNTACKRLL